MKSKAAKPNVLGRVGHFNIAHDGKTYLLLKPKRVFTTPALKTKAIAQTYAANLVKIGECERALEDLKTQRGILTESVISRRKKKYEKMAMEAMLENEKIVA
ncbi:hypothetical protein [Flavobacterium sp.]|jgi:hypothetical protein|uniref:hypothetical protein n=1 Tax=Flavobacterium sp. TaxID=239 RepID=UPI0037BF6D75